jgi:hypothetical protein
METQETVLATFDNDLNMYRFVYVWETLPKTSTFFVNLSKFTILFEQECSKHNNLWNAERDQIASHCIRQARA